MDFGELEQNILAGAEGEKEKRGLEIKRSITGAREEEKKEAEELKIRMRDIGAKLWNGPGWDKVGIELTGSQLDPSFYHP